MFETAKTSNGGAYMAENLSNLKNVEYHASSQAEIYIAELELPDLTLNITYNCTNGNLFIHEWYQLDDAEYDSIRKPLLKYFENLYENRRAS